MRSADHGSVGRVDSMEEKKSMGSAVEEIWFRNEEGERVGFGLQRTGSSAEEALVYVRRESEV